MRNRSVNLHLLVQTMEISLILKLIAYSGGWRPISWTSRCRRAIYNIYSVIIICTSFSFTLSQVINSLTVNNVDDFVESTYLLIASFVGCCKITNLLLYRKGIIGLLKTFTKHPCSPLNAEEMRIQMKYDKQMENNALRYLMFIEFAILVNILKAYLIDFQNNKLTYEAWIPYNYSSTIAFRLTHMYQLLSLIILSFIHVACDSLFCGLLMQMCCQFDILECRLQNGNLNKSILRKSVRHHNNIYQLATMTNDTLSITIFAQFSGGFLCLCLGLAQLLKEDNFNTTFLATMMYLSSMMLQNFLYCWHGNEVKLKSIGLARAIFQIDWTELNEGTKKLLLVVMDRTRSPIEFNSVYVITVNLDFYMIVIKSSYSAYSVLQTSQN
ncbi:odorant receptor 94b-like [Calliopsis andreniformis]|uniref:odorant receptor 94b-like n=1 Tax=Calliopsis andreniformis TaxID=337506 RepID=UPI003FCEDF3E